VGVPAKAASIPDSAVKVKTAEQAWIAFRDAYIEATYPAKDKATEYGSMYPLEVELLRAKLTRQQISTFERLVEEVRRLGIGRG
jgi:uncharacterized protein YecT (DUF1311 family)